MSAFVVGLSRGSAAAIVRNRWLHAILTIRSFIKLAPNFFFFFYRSLALIMCSVRSVDSVIVVLNISN